MPRTASGRAIASSSASTAPIESPATKTASTSRASASTAASTLFAQSRQPVATRSATLPQCPASWTAWTVKPAACRPRATKRISVGVPARPWTSSTPARPPGHAKAWPGGIAAASGEVTLGTRQHLIEEDERELDLVGRDVQRRRERHDVLVVAADVEDEAELLAAAAEVAGKPDLDHAADELLVRREAVALADLGAQRETEAVDVADLGMAALQLSQALQEMGALRLDDRRVVALAQHLHRLDADRGAERVRREGRVRRARRKDGRADQRLLRPESRERVEPVGERLAEDDDVGRDAEVLDRPELAGAKKAHLDLVDDEQDAVPVEHLLQPREVVRRRNHVAAGALHGLDVERGVFRLVRARVPDALVLALEQALELAHAVLAVLLLGHPGAAAEVVRERHEVRAIAEVAEAAAIAIARRDRRGAERAAVVTALEGEHQALAAARIADELERILDRLRAADVELDSSLRIPLGERILGNRACELDLGRMQVLARDLREHVELPAHRVGQALVGVAEVDGRVPHLEVEVRDAAAVEQVAARAAFEDLRRLDVVHRVAERAEARFVGEERALVHATSSRGAANAVPSASSRHARVASAKSTIGRCGRPRSAQCSRRLDFANVSSARAAAQKSEAPSPTSSVGRSPASRRHAHLHVAAPLVQPARACGNERPHSRGPSWTSRLARTSSSRTAARASIAATTVSSPSLAIVSVPPSAWTAATKPVNAGSIAMSPTCAWSSSRLQSSSAICPAMHVRAVIRPAS